MIIEKQLFEATGAPPVLQPSVQLKAQLRLREMILAGELPGGARIAELSIVEKLGFSRTPIRAALMRLEQEGLLNALPNAVLPSKLFPSAMCLKRSSCAARWRVCRHGWRLSGVPPRW